MQNGHVLFYKAVYLFIVLSITIGCASNPVPVVIPNDFDSTPISVPFTFTPPLTSTNSPIIADLSTQRLFLFGANYPWYNYGTDFGENTWGYSGVSAKRNEIEADFEKMSDAGIQVVRWFVFADGRASPDFLNDGAVAGLDAKVFTDLDAALEIAQRHNIHLILVLLDFHWLGQPSDESGVKLGGHADVIVDSSKRDTFFQNALIPILQRYGQNPYILAWEVINEPEWAIDDPDIKTDMALIRVPRATMQEFVSKTVQIIHEYTVGQFTTVGSASRRWWSLWENTGLDICQFHFYDWMEDDQNSKLDFPYADIGTELPCLIGEFPTKDTNLTLDEYYQSIYRNEYAGALPWSLRSEDNKSDLGNQLQIVHTWSQQLAGKIEISVPEGWILPTPTPTDTPFPTQTTLPSPTLLVTSTTDPNADTNMYGFETRDDEWVFQDYEDSQAVYSIHRVQSPVHLGKYALQLDVNLVPKDDHLSKGEAYVEVIPFPPIDNSVGPYNLENSIVTCWVYVPSEAYSVNSNPWIGIQIFVKDQKYKSEYGEWKRVNPANAGKWLPFLLKPRRFPPPDGYMDKGFDPITITTIGVKIGVDNYYAKTGVAYNGPVYIDACSWK